MRNWLLVSASAVCLVGLAQPAPAAARTTGFCGPICQLIKNTVTAEASPVSGEEGSAGVSSGGDDSLDGVGDTNDDVDEVEDDSDDDSSDDSDDDSEDDSGADAVQ